LHLHQGCKKIRWKNMGVFLATAMVQPNQLTEYSWLAKRTFCLANRNSAERGKPDSTKQN